LPRTIRNRKNLKFDFDLGNLADIYISHQSLWKDNKIEIGYDATFAFGASSLPHNSLLLLYAELQRNTFFMTYTKDFKIHKYPGGLLFGFSYGFDTLPPIYGYKRILTFWLSGSISF